MTDEQLTSAALALAGWEYAPTTDGAKDRPWRNHSKMQRLAEHQLPSFLTGPEALGNVQSLIDALSDGQKWEMIKGIVEWKGKAGDFPLLARSEAIKLLEATPRQRLLALLRTLKPELFQ